MALWLPWAPKRPCAASNTIWPPPYKSDMQGTTPYALDGAPIYFPENGSFDTSVARMVAGNFKQLVYAIRQDVDVKILDQAVIQYPQQGHHLNLAHQDMIALRVTFRMGWAMPNPATRMNENRVNVPFPTLTPRPPTPTRL